jgi:hypothetical protein
MIIKYLKGIGGLILVVCLAILAVVFFAVFNSLLAVAMAILAIVAIILLPYYFGRKDQPEQSGNYSLKKIK